MADGYKPLLQAGGRGSDVPASAAVDVVALHMLSPSLFEQYLLAAFRDGIVSFSDTHRAGLFCDGAFDRVNPLVKRVRPSIRRVRVAWDPRRAERFARALREDRLLALEYLHVGKRRQCFEDRPAPVSARAEGWPKLFHLERDYFRGIAQDIGRGITGFVMKHEDDWCERLTTGAGRFGVCGLWVEAESNGGMEWDWHEPISEFPIFQLFLSCSREDKRRIGEKMDAQTLRCNPDKGMALMDVAKHQRLRAVFDRPVQEITYPS